MVWFFYVQDAEKKSGKQYEDNIKGADRSSAGILSTVTPVMFTKEKHAESVACILSWEIE